ncbi:hypothetical protein HYE68_008954 [Fusarium pseudograminearum]|nr:hypothetical protein HYE68_008954 [Fusarium pseudograminearum]
MGGDTVAYCKHPLDTKFLAYHIIASLRESQTLWDDIMPQPRPVSISCWYMHAAISLCRFTSDHEKLTLMSATDFLQQNGIIIAEEGRTLHLAQYFVFWMIGTMSSLYNVATPDKSQSCWWEKFTIVTKCRITSHLFWCFLTSDVNRPRAQGIEWSVSRFLAGFGEILPTIDRDGRTKVDEFFRLDPGRLNMQLLESSLGFKVVWTDILGSHLDVDINTSTLFLFRQATLCIREAADNVDETTVLRSCLDDEIMDRDELRTLMREILLSLYILFGQTAGSRGHFREDEAFKDISRKWRDGMLKKVCCEPWLFEDFDQQPKRIYNLQADFPILGAKLRFLAQEVQSQEPKSLRQLWKDKRNTLQWWTFWAVIIFGGVATLLSLIQTILAGLQLRDNGSKDTGTSRQPSNTLNGRTFIEALCTDIVTRMGKDEVMNTESEAPMSRAGSATKEQPWRKLSSCLEETLAKHGSFQLEKPDGKIPSWWNDLERGRLPANHKELLSELVQEKFDGKPWYKREEGSRCDSCGRDPCICMVFEVSIVYPTVPRLLTYLATFSQPQPMMETKQSLASFMNPTSTNHDPSNVNKEAEASWQSRPKTTGTVRFLSPHPKYENEKPFILSLPLPKDQPKSNAIYETHDIKIADARGDERSFSLDQQGFEFVEIPSRPTAVSSKEAIEGDYLPQMERFLKEHLKANRVIAFDHVANAPAQLRQVKPLGVPHLREDKRPPARNAHTDQTPEAAMSRLQLYFQNEASGLVQDRVRFLNIWRPLVEPLEDAPLGVLDARTLSTQDLIAQDMVYSHYLGENYQVRFNPSQRWYYWSRMMRNECILIKNFDSRMDGVARSTSLS